MRIKRHTVTKGSSPLVGAGTDPADRNLKMAWCKAKRLVEDVSFVDDLVRSVAHSLISRGCRRTRSVALSQSPISM